MEVNDITKLIYAVGITGSICIVSIGIYRLLVSITKNIDDLRKTVQNLGELSDGLVEDEKLLREAVKYFVEVGRKLKDMTVSISEKIVKPLTQIFSFLKTIQKITSRFTKKQKD